VLIWLSLLPLPSFLKRKYQAAAPPPMSNKNEKKQTIHFFLDFLDVSSNRFLLSPCSVAASGSFGIRTASMASELTLFLFAPVFLSEFVKLSDSETVLPIDTRLATASGPPFSPSPVLLLPMLSVSDATINRRVTLSTPGLDKNVELPLPARALAFASESFPYKVLVVLEASLCTLSTPGLLAN